MNFSIQMILENLVNEFSIASIINDTTSSLIIDRFPPFLGGDKRSLKIFYFILYSKIARIISFV